MRMGNISTQVYIRVWYTRCTSGYLFHFHNCGFGEQVLYSCPTESIKRHNIILELCRWTVNRNNNNNNYNNSNNNINNNKRVSQKRQSDDQTGCRAISCVMIFFSKTFREVCAQTLNKHSFAFLSFPAGHERVFIFYSEKHRNQSYLYCFKNILSHSHNISPEHECLSWKLADILDGIDYTDITFCFLIYTYFINLFIPILYLFFKIPCKLVVVWFLRWCNLF